MAQNNNNNNKKKKIGDEILFALYSSFTVFFFFLIIFHHFLCTFLQNLYDSLKDKIFLSFICNSQYTRRNTVYTVWLHPYLL